ncbi:cytochrome c [Loktanella sp. PT4BL]|jgi:mono/diheme cytochrome c family protein|uniref:c-type cytochrome n=1 Tax=Rhodobacterales TaxID=204455 RepID=UPI000D76FDA8|nr:cytochrome c [Loktanella sp. PT4BL]PXW68957.1 cytochrome c [Loktanella sp. PT4BL]
MKHSKTAVIFAFAALLHPGLAMADDIGQAEYMNTCATCHGASGEGDGPFVELMSVPVPALTGLSAANDGKFPMLDVIYTIDGRQGTRGHGFPMPVWGARFKSETGVDSDMSSEMLVRARILSLALYLESIQQE